MDGREKAFLGLRERHKRERRERIAAAALKLFDAQGFQATTIAEIAELADVSPRTISSYFPVKEELAFPDNAEWLKRFREWLADRDAGVSTLDVLREWLEICLNEWAEDEEVVQARRRVIDAAPELRAYEQRVMGEVSEVLRVEIARDLGREPGDLEPRIAAAATTAVFEALGDFSKGDEGAALAGAERAIRFVAAGIRALEE